MDNGSWRTQNQFVNSCDPQTNNCSSNSSKRHGESTALGPCAKRQRTEIVSPTAGLLSPTAVQSRLRHLNCKQKGTLGDVLDDEVPLEDVSRDSGFGETHHSHNVSVTEQMRQNQAIMMQIAASLANVNNQLNKFEKIDSSQLTSSESVSNSRKEPHDLSSSDVSECES